MGIRAFVLMCSLAVPAFSQEQSLVVHRQSMRVDLYERGILQWTFPVRIGSEDNKTPLGKGYISEKIRTPIFRYVDPGPKKGKIVDFSECVEETIRIDYREMRALRMIYTGMTEPRKEIRRRGLSPKGEYRFSVHSVVCPETIGKAISKGCVGLSIPDMLRLYKAVRVDRKKNIFPQFEVRDD